MTILGGRGRRGRANCKHSETIAITSAGIERIVCDACGNVSFMFLDGIMDEIDRDLFARTVDQPKTASTLGISA